MDREAKISNQLPRRRQVTAMKKSRILTLTILLLATIFTLSVFTSCSASMDMEADGNFYPEESPEMGGDVNLELGDPSFDKGDGEYQRKIIKTARINAETRQFEESIARIEEICKSAGGYIESSSISGTKLEYFENGGYRSASYTLRIPAEGFDQFNVELGNLINVVRSSSNVDEITNQYYDIQSRIEVLELQKQSLQSMYDNYTDYKDINTLLYLQDQLYNVIEEIESYKTQLRLYDSKVAYSTVYLDITEVVEYTEVKEELPFIEELKNAFLGGFDFSVSLLKGTAIVIAAVTPVLVPILLPVIIVAGIVALITTLSVKASRRRKSKKLSNQ